MIGIRIRIEIGTKFTKFVSDVLEHDAHWLKWKFAKKELRCEALKRKPFDADTCSLPSSKHRRKNKETFPMGDKNLSRVFAWTLSVYVSKKRQVGKLKRGANSLDFLKQRSSVDLKLPAQAARRPRGCA